MSDYRFNAIGKVHACFTEKFGVPRQPGLVKHESSIEIFPPYDRVEAFRGLTDFSHVWIVFVFHQTMQQGWNPTVRPPRLGGNERVGVFASRSMFRPNPIGLSVVELKAVREDGTKIFVDIIGADLVDGTPVLDIKPYLPYVDAIADARGAYAEAAPARKIDVIFTSQALADIQNHASRYPQLQALITDVLQYDPRPAYQPDSTRTKIDFAMRLYDLDVKWRMAGEVAEVYGVVSFGA
jgi:tRNA-Thr(GGU) m(6)t(6)A37 methyltransferase TsaA